MLVLFAAAAIGAAPAATETLNVYRLPSHCADIQRRVAERQKEPFRQLGRLPPARAMYAVMRKIDGCPIAAPMGYRQDYLLPGAADAPEFRREDAPADRR